MNANPETAEARQRGALARHAAHGNGVCLVVGASRGIGLALVETLLGATSVKRVLATHRPTSDTKALRQLAEPDRLQLQSLDVADDRSLRAFERVVAGIGGGVDLAIHAAGLLHDGEVQPEKSLEQCDPRQLMRLFEVNSIGPLMVARALLPQLDRKRPFIFAALSAMVGSIGDNRLGGWYGYRASKTALNQFVKTLANECRTRHPKGIVVAVHPGTTDTDLSKPFQRGVKSGKLYSPAQTARRLVAVLDGLGTEDSGRFLNWDGSGIPW